VEQEYGCRAHRFNPPHRSTYNSDVEAVHGLMEPEFYELERFRGSVRQFLIRSTATSYISTSYGAMATGEAPPRTSCAPPVRLP